MSIVAEYRLPDQSVFQSRPAGEVSQRLEYVCVAHSFRCTCAEALKDHIQGRVHMGQLIDAGFEEDPDIIEILDYFMELERPHREAKKEEERQKGKDFVEKIKALSNESKQLIRKFPQGCGNSSQPWLKKPRYWKPFECRACRIELTSPEEVFAHWRGEEHRRRTQGFICGICCAGSFDMQASERPRHFKGTKHLKRCTQLAQLGVDVSLLEPSSSADTPGGMGLDVGAAGGQMGHDISSGVPAPAVVGTDMSYCAPVPGMTALSEPRSSRGKHQPRVQAAVRKTPIDWFKCAVCPGVELTTVEDLVDHMQSREHVQNGASYKKGCDICGVKGIGKSALREHYQGQKHLKRVARLESYGLDVGYYKSFTGVGQLGG